MRPGRGWNGGWPEKFIAAAAVPEWGRNLIRSGRRGALRVTPLQDTHTETLVASLRTSIGVERWSVWFDGATDFQISAEGLTVGVANLFIADYLKSHFGREIEVASLEVCGRRLQVTYRVESRLFQKRRNANLVGEAEAIDKLGADVTQRPAGATQAYLAKSPARDSRPHLHGGPTQADRQFQTGRSLQAGRPLPEGKPLFTLENFVTGPCNAMAYAAAQAAVTAPGKDFHPLFIHGGCGLGKTHLIQAILHGLRGRQNLQVACLSAEQFTNQYLACMRTGSLDAFRHRYRHMDVLAIDDIHFLAGKPATQEEFLHTFNEFDGDGRLVILASDSHPREIEALQDHLISRFVSGLVVRMSPPDDMTRLRILEAKAIQMRHRLPEAVLALIGERVRGNVRDLEGALTRVVAYAGLLHMPMTVDLAREALADYVVATPPACSLTEISETVTGFFGVTASDIHSARKSRQISLARQITMVLARDLTGMSFADIARGLGDKNHTTVLAACRKWQRMIKEAATVTWTDRSDLRTMPADSLISNLRDRIKK
jgi:chromosomal replication initiator protein